MEFVAKTRLLRAAELLGSTAVSIKVIAACIGYSSRSHFSRAFRNEYGTDPRQFRRRIALGEGLEQRAAVGDPDKRDGDASVRGT